MFVFDFPQRVYVSQPLHDAYFFHLTIHHLKYNNLPKQLQQLLTCTTKKTQPQPQFPHEKNVVDQKTISSIIYQTIVVVCFFCLSEHLIIYYQHTYIKQYKYIIISTTETTLCPLDTVDSHIIDSSVVPQRSHFY